MLTLQPVPSHRIVATYSLIGMLLGALVLHPVTMVIYWFEFNSEAARLPGILAVIEERLSSAFTGAMAPMALLMAAVGAAIGGTLGVSARALARRNQTLARLRFELANDIASLIAAGEGERTEFKSSARWDYFNRKRNRAIEEIVVQTIAAFLNHRGGSLLIGVDDNGVILGLRADYDTLRDKNRDGFERFLMGLVKTRIGGALCPHVHPIFHDIDGRDVCRVVIEPASRPVYVRRGDTAHYYVRTGNATRELDVKEALKHISERYPGVR